jgi:hypothetical protein
MDDRMRGKVIVGIMVAAALCLLGATTGEAQPGWGWRGSGGLGIPPGHGRRPHPQKKKHLLHQLVKKVLIHSRQTIEIWYLLPSNRRFADCNIWLPICNSIRSRPGCVEPEAYFRIVHLTQDGHPGAPVAGEQTVEIALGPKGAFENGNIGALRLRAPPSRVVSLASSSNPNRQESPRLRVAELLRKAIVGGLETGETSTRLTSRRKRSPARITRSGPIRLRRRSKKRSSPRSAYSNVAP